MASEDVIELGSSDEEAEPAPKKKKILPNAMVHIPGKLPGITIKPANKVLPAIIPNNQSLAKAIARKAITLTKIPSSISSKNVSRMVNPLAIKKPAVKSQFKMYPSCSTMPSQAMLPLQINPCKIPQTIARRVTNVMVKRTSAVKLPSSITIKKTVTKKPLPSVKKKQKVNKNVVVTETVNLDDDEAPSNSKSKSTNPQWYMTPEESNKEHSIENKNNKEPEIKKTIEITIEDSPVKPVKNKHIQEYEVPITIDDSPIKVILNKNPNDPKHSDEEGHGQEKEYQSRKKLKYPSNCMTIEKIEVELEEIKEKENTEVAVNSNDNMVVAPKSTVNRDEEVATISDSDSQSQTETKSNEVTDKTVADVENEFHPIYQNFIDLCFKFENSDDMKKIVDRKIKSYYKQVPKEYTESEEFLDMVSIKIMAMKADPEKTYLYMKDIVDELNLQRKMAKSQKENIEKEKKAEADNYLYGEDSIYDSKRQRQIRKLEKTLKKLHRAIQKLEEQEVDFDDEEDSVYLLTERYKERMVRVHAKFCQLTNTKMPSEPRVQIDARPGQPVGPAKRLEKWINKKVPIGTPLPFPDFHDVLRCVKEANEEDKIGWNEVDVMEEARDLFTRCGRKLQRRRQENEWRLAVSRISVEVDPAEQSDELKKKLENNKQVATVKETEVFNKYADRQNQLKLEAVEIGDKEAEESPVESDEDEPPEEDSSLETKEKRKERLKRLIQEKSKKVEDLQEIAKIQENIDDKTEKETENEQNSKTDETGVKKPETEKVDTLQTVSNENKETKDENKEMEVENEISENTKHTKEDNENNSDIVLCLSDDNEVESDIDELHLLQKLHSANEANSSTVDSSDSETPIDISDTLDSSTDAEKEADVISIENSSYSESEVNNDKNKEFVTVAIELTEDTNVRQVDDVIMNTNIEMECSTGGVEKNNIQEMENILLASTDEESTSDKNSGSPGVCVNLTDDAISINETTMDDCSHNDKLNTERNDDDNILKEHNLNGNENFGSETIVDTQGSKAEASKDHNNLDDDNENISVAVVDTRGSNAEASNTDVVHDKQYKTDATSLESTDLDKENTHNGTENPNAVKKYEDNSKQNEKISKFNSVKDVEKVKNDLIAVQNVASELVETKSKKAEGEILGGSNKEVDCNNTEIDNISKEVARIDSNQHLTNSKVINISGASAEP